MADRKQEDPGGFDAKNNARHEPKDAAGKAGGYEDAQAKERSEEHAGEKDAVRKPI